MAGPCLAPSLPSARVHLLPTSSTHACGSKALPAPPPASWTDSSTDHSGHQDSNPDPGSDEDQGTPPVAGADVATEHDQVGHVIKEDPEEDRYHSLAHLSSSDFSMAGDSPRNSSATLALSDSDDVDEEQEEEQEEGEEQEEQEEQEEEEDSSTAELDSIDTVAELQDPAAAGGKGQAERVPVHNYDRNLLPFKSAIRNAGPLKRRARMAPAAAQPSPVVVLPMTPQPAVVVTALAGGQPPVVVVASPTEQQQPTGGSALSRVPSTASTAAAAALPRHVRFSEPLTVDAYGWPVHPVVSKGVSKAHLLVSKAIEVVGAITGVTLGLSIWDGLLGPAVMVGGVWWAGSKVMAALRPRRARAWSGF